MILNLLKNLILALLLDAGAALAFDVQATAGKQPAVAAQSCLLPPAATADDARHATLISDAGTRS